MTMPNKVVRELKVTELLAEEITHWLMRADHVEPREVEALVDRLHAERTRAAVEDWRGEARS